MPEQDHRIERDSMGEVRVPAGAKWRAQTQRAVENFPVSGQPIEPAQIAALGRIKAAAARVNAALGVLEPKVAEAIEELHGAGALFEALTPDRFVVTATSQAALTHVGGLLPWPVPWSAGQDRPG